MTISKKTAEGKRCINNRTIKKTGGGYLILSTSSHVMTCTKMHVLLKAKP